MTSPGHEPMCEKQALVRATHAGGCSRRLPGAGDEVGRQVCVRGSRTSHPGVKLDILAGAAVPHPAQTQW